MTDPLHATGHWNGCDGNPRTCNCGGDSGNEYYVQSVDIDWTANCTLCGAELSFDGEAATHDDRAKGQKCFEARFAK